MGLPMDVAQRPRIGHIENFDRVNNRYSFFNGILFIEGAMANFVNRHNTTSFYICICPPILDTGLRRGYAIQVLPRRLKASRPVLS